MLSGNLFLKVVFGIQLLTLCWEPHSYTLPAEIKAHGHGGKQYFRSVFTTKCLHGLEEINYKLGKLI